MTKSVTENLDERVKSLELLADRNGRQIRFHDECLGFHRRQMERIEIALIVQGAIIGALIGLVTFLIISRL